MSQRKQQPRRGQKPADAPETENDRIAGRNPVLEALRSDAKIDLIYVGQESGGLQEIIRLAKEKGCIAIALCNVVGSSIPREADAVIYTQAGPEISVASTKAMCSQMVIMALIALYYA